MPAARTQRKKTQPLFTNKLQPLPSDIAASKSINLVNDDMNSKEDKSVAANKKHQKPQILRYNYKLNGETKIVKQRKHRERQEGEILLDFKPKKKIEIIKGNHNSLPTMDVQGPVVKEDLNETGYRAADPCPQNLPLPWQFNMPMDPDGNMMFGNEFANNLFPFDPIFPVHPEFYDNNFPGVYDDFSSSSGQ
ncbi:hypothetical protein SCHPADRAFT_602793 [Schizopora paradoxa]|uniref:Uncharacterized protein n=1 Tax=Schizopora paradoxa TaxID=27342 RepID=A0A0H2RB14_9AGAM|nr:hypothetical protein SCHPADRAFT_602793 [Schizopora paradoxa]